MTESRVVCCCGVTTWSIVIGWIQIVLHSIDALLVILALVGVVAVDLDDKNKDGHIKEAVLAILCVFLIVYIVGILFGVLLLRGAYQRRAGYLNAWLVYALILLIFAIIGAAFGTGDLTGRIVQAVISAVIYSFGIWVVYILKEEIQHDARLGQLP